MPITEQTVLTFPASKGWLVRLALDTAAKQIAVSPPSHFDDPDGTMTVQICVATYLPKRGNS
jgi:hypothetical protein